MKDKKKTFRRKSNKRKTNKKILLKRRTFRKKKKIKNIRGGSRTSIVVKRPTKQIKGYNTVVNVTSPDGTVSTIQPGELVSLSTTSPERNLLRSIFKPYKNFENIECETSEDINKIHQLKNNMNYKSNLDTNFKVYNDTTPNFYDSELKGLLSNMLEYQVFNITSLTIIPNLFNQTIIIFGENHTALPDKDNKTLNILNETTKEDITNKLIGGEYLFNLIMKKAENYLKCIAFEQILGEKKMSYTKSSFMDYIYNKNFQNQKKYLFNDEKKNIFDDKKICQNKIYENYIDLFDSDAKMYNIGITSIFLKTQVNVLMYNSFCNPGLRKLKRNNYRKKNLPPQFIKKQLEEFDKTKEEMKSYFRLNSIHEEFYNKIVIFLKNNFSDKDNFIREIYLDLINKYETILHRTFSKDEIISKLLTKNYILVMFLYLELLNIYNSSEFLKLIEFDENIFRSDFHSDFKNKREFINNVNATEKQFELIYNISNDDCKKALLNWAIGLLFNNSYDYIFEGTGFNKNITEDYLNNYLSNRIEDFSNIPVTEENYDHIPEIYNDSIEITQNFRDSYIAFKMISRCSFKSTLGIMFVGDVNDKNNDYNEIIENYPEHSHIKNWYIIWNYLNREIKRETLNYGYHSPKIESQYEYNDEQEGLKFRNEHISIKKIYDNLENLVEEPAIED